MAHKFNVGDKVTRKNDHLGARWVKDKVYIVSARREESPSSPYIAIKGEEQSGDIYPYDSSLFTLYMEKEIISKFKIGDKVVATHYGKTARNRDGEMDKYIGTGVVLEISYVSSTYCDTKHMDGDIMSWTWDKDSLQLVQSNEIIPQSTVVNKKETTIMLYQVGISAVKLQTGTNPQTKKLIDQPEFLEASSTNEAVALYTLKKHAVLSKADFDILEIMVKN